jgi:peptide/nickel transport system substrate-binding protein
MLACSGGDRGTTPSGGQTGTKEPKRGGVINYAGGLVGAWDTRGNSFDPHIESALGTANYRLFYQGILGYHPRSYEIEAELVQKWEQPSQTEYLFTLQPGVKWHNKAPANGRALTAEDIAFSLNRARTNEPRFQHASLFVSVDKIEAASATTVRLTTKAPDATLLAKLSGDGCLVLAPEVVDRTARLATAEHVVGTGPFVMRSVEERVAANYVRNPDYWKPGRPYLDEVRVLHVNDEQTGYAGFQAGQIDIARLNGAIAKEYITKQGSGYQPDWFKDVTMIAMTPNVTQKPMDDARITRALRLLMDHEEWRTAWCEVWFGRGRHGSIICTALDQWDFTEDEYARNIFWKSNKDEAVREAMSLLSAAGYNRDNPLRFDLVGHQGGFSEAAPQLLQGQWRRLGQGVVDATIRNLFELPVALQTQASGNFTYGCWGLAGAATEPDAWLTQLYHSNGSRNRLRFKDPQVDALIDKQRATFDLAQRKATIKEILTYMMDKSPGVIGSNRYYLQAVNPKVQEYAPEFYINGRQYEWMWLDS